MATLQATELVKRFPARRVVDGVSLSVDSGEVVGLLGPNGAGKTTCFYLIVGLLACDGGRIRLDEHDLTSAPMHVRARRGLGYLPQEPSVFRKLNVRQNILAILELRRDLDHRQRQLRLDELLDELHIAHLAEQPGISLSGGERRRVEIARALATEPRFILLDEPFAGVDPISVGDIRSIVQHLCDRDIGVLITDHNVRETLGICDRAYILNEGRVIAAGEPAEILVDPHVREVYLGQDFRM
ncbi:LPS export ABC transporter ATP-binding protein [Thiohalobacter sp. IOR34]|uniref:LPS export ABC transporter ATP-binding protein n=1 Tax=Thiohalobacter sp. IOR34 TaxID=3057176 RepID=UPI0025B1B34C|nr:LPS export ABC transporter ATP-binding protein [Thiohalobacter sp. IOR34]WJW74859.1 LPS export ABC transporter ATP-binding protein [Thiohalobacter sp. IOR34]